ncbi:MAG: sugar phosphate isomerase/epimerase family protein [Planctomycetota bacterium]
MSISIDQIALTCFTIRDHCQTEDDFSRSIDRLRGIGYQTVQVSAVPLEPAVVRRICDAAGMRICASHDGGDPLFDDTQAVIDKLQTYGCTATAYPHPHVSIETYEDVCALAEKLDQAGAAMRAAGMVLTYHNHHHELRRIGDQTILEHLYRLTDPAHLQGEIDTYWIQRGGADPVAWIQRLQGRLPLLHLKDFEFRAGDQKQHFGAIGDGNLDWPRILRAAATAGCQWYIVEQDSNWYNDDPFQAAERSFRYLADLVPTLSRSPTCI